MGIKTATIDAGGDPYLIGLEAAARRELTRLYGVEEEAAQLRTENLGLRTENGRLNARIDADRRIVRGLLDRIQQLEADANRRVVLARSQAEPQEGHR
jgi:hypothetical protein